MAPSLLSPAGPAAAHIERLWWLMFWVLGAVFVIVTLAVLYASLRRRRHSGEAAAGAGSGPGPDPRLDHDDRRAIRWVLVSGAAIPLVILVGLFLYTLSTLRALEAHGEDPVLIEVAGVDWWWRVRYLEAGSEGYLFETANEIHIPVGRPVELRLLSEDVIHSFWVPQLAGKLDMIPGRTNVLRLQADEPGVYRGQCAEYCGLQHTNMVVHVVAEPEEAFAAWLTEQQTPAAVPAAGSDASLGMGVFLTSACVACHTVRGTTARSTYGPDLTHVASRGSLGAGTVPNRPGHMGGWIGNPQRLKPGVHMPAVPLSSQELRYVTAYMMNLR